MPHLTQNMLDLFPDTIENHPLLV